MSRNLLPPLEHSGARQKRETEFPHSPTSMLNRTFTTRPSRVVIKTRITLLINGTNFRDQSQTLQKHPEHPYPSQVGTTLAKAFNGGDNPSQPVMGLKRNDSHPDRGYVQLVDDASDPN